MHSLLREQQDMELPAELAGGPVKAVDLDAIFGYAVRPDPRLEEERWKEDDAEPLVVAPAATTVIEEPEEIDAEAEAEFIEASIPESTEDFDGESDDEDFAVEESDEDDAEPKAPTPSSRRRRRGGRPRHRPQPRRDRPTAAPQEGSLNITLRPRPP